jgi:hypothetical protein
MRVNKDILITQTVRRVAFSTESLFSVLRKHERLKRFMKLFLQDLAKYLKEIFGESQRIVFTVFDIIGIILFFFPHLAQGLVDDEALARNIGGLIFFVSFLSANFNLFRKLSVKSTASVLPQRKMEKWHPCYSSQKEPKP